MLPVEGISGHQLFVFRIQQKHQPQQLRDQAAIEVLLAFFALREIAQHTSAGVLRQPLGRIETEQQFPQGFQHLLGQARAHLDLILAAGGE